MQPQVIYTDNVNADRAFLMKIFPSLSEDVIPSEKYRHLPVFDLSSDTKVEVYRTEADINQALQSILDDVPAEPTQEGSNSIVVGLDCEWNIEHGFGERVVGQGPVSVVQIAYKDKVYILQVWPQPTICKTDLRAH